jgi:hypothetical protein
MRKKKLFLQTIFKLIFLITRPLNYAQGKYILILNESMINKTNQRAEQTWIIQ